MLTLKQIRRIARLRELGCSQRSVARQMHIHRATVRRYWNWLGSEEDNLVHTSRSSRLEPYREYIYGLFLKCPNCVEILPLVIEYTGKPCSLRRLQLFVKPLRDQIRILDREGKDVRRSLSSEDEEHIEQNDAKVRRIIKLDVKKSKTRIERLRATLRKPRKKKESTQVEP